MNQNQLKKEVAKNSLLFYGRRPIHIIKIYDIFNLVDVVYDGESKVFTVDVMTLDSSPSTENTIQIF